MRASLQRWRTTRGMSTVTTVDIHVRLCPSLNVFRVYASAPSQAHFLPKAWPDFAQRHGGSGWPSLRHSGELPDGVYGYQRTCDAMLMSGGQDFRPVTRACWDPLARLEDLDKCGIDIQLISATPILFQWERPGARSASIYTYIRLHNNQQ